MSEDYKRRKINILSKVTSPGAAFRLLQSRGKSPERMERAQTTDPNLERGKVWNGKKQIRDH